MILGSILASKRPIYFPEHIKRCSALPYLLVGRTEIALSCPIFRQRLGPRAAASHVDMPALARCIVNSVHQVEHMIGQLAIGAMRAAAADRIGHVGHAQAAAVLG